MDYKNKHLFFKAASEFIKYRGESNQIDYKDTIINILSNRPGLELKEIFDLMFTNEQFEVYPEDLDPIYKQVKFILEGMIKDEYIITNSGQHFLWDDAWSHDVAKTQKTMEDLMAKGLTKEQVTFLSSAIIMAGENHVAEVGNNVYDPMKTEANSPAVKPEAPVVVTGQEFPTKEECSEECDGNCACEANDNHVDYQSKELLPDVQEDTVPVGELGEQYNCEKLEPRKIELVIETDEVINPFVNMTFEDIHAHNLNTLADMAIEEQLEKERLIEVERVKEEERLAQIELDRQNQEQADRLEAIRQEELATAEKIRLEEEAKEEAIRKYKNSINSITDGVKLLGLKIQFISKDPSIEVVATILELKADGMLMLIVFSNDPVHSFHEGEIVNILYSEGLRYKIKA